MLRVHSFCLRANLLPSGGLLDRLHGDDAMCPCGFLHPCGLHPDDSVGQRQTRQLLKGVQRLSDPALLHPPLHPVEPGRSNPAVCPHPSLFFFIKRTVSTLDVRKCAEVDRILVIWTPCDWLFFFYMKLHSKDCRTGECRTVKRRREQCELNTAKS